jgi:CHAT domain-containing protein
MSELFRVSSANPTLSHGEALREAILTMINSAANDDEAHPRLWAPFVVVGEPTKKM